MTATESLTRERILAMPAGPEMDSLVAERVFGMVWRGGNPVPNYDGRWPWPPPYSTGIAAAWQVVEKLGLGVVHQGYDDEEDTEGVGYLAFGYPRNFGPGLLMRLDRDCLSVEAPTTPLAICRAALLTTLEDSP